MNTHDVLLTIQYITISVLFVEIWIVFQGWKNQMHSYLFLACIASFVSNLGYLFELKSGTEEEYIMALKLSYAGRVWIIFAFFLFAAKMCRIKLPGWLVAILAIVHCGIYLSVLMIGFNGLYYSAYSFIKDPEFPQFRHENGIVHDLFMTLNGVFALISMRWVIMAYRREKNESAKRRMFLLILSFGVQVLSFVLQLTGIFGITDYYDLTMPGVLFGTVFMLIGIFGFDLLGTREIARDFVIDRISEGIIAVDHDGRIQYYNEPVTKLYPEFDAFFRSASLQNNLKTVRTPYDIISSITDAVHNGKNLNIDGRIYTPEENELIYNGESYGRLYALVDDTEHYLYMDELQKQKDIADSANEAKSRFLASMSHEIRTPINAVLGMDEMILRESGEKNIREYAANIMSAGRTLLSLINDILDLSKVEEGRMSIIPVQYELSSMINDLANMIRTRAAEKGLELHINAAPDTPGLLIGDEIRIRQCVMNLLTNAVKYTESGKVDLKISYEKTDDMHILLDFTVEDTGIGMKEEDMAKLFSPYERIEEKRNRTIEGTGLGMSITRQLLELMGSELQVRSEYGKGSVFSFTLEQEVAGWEGIGDITSGLNGEQGEDHEYHELFHAPKARILVVDDTEMNLTVIRSLLKKTLIRIDTALSGAEAVKLADNTSYDLIFIDHMMPDMDGIETLKAIRRAGISKDTPAVALTANAVSGAREMYLGAGFTDYLSKPVDGEKLERMLMYMLPDEKKEPADGGDGAHVESSDDENYVNQTDAQTDMFMDRLKDTDEIDEQSGLKNCGSVEGYMSVLSVFHQTAAAKADEIEALYNNGDTDNYTIKVHALKSSARIIGAGQLSALAKELEDAGNRKDIEVINSNTKILLDMYRTVDSRLSWLDDTQGDLPEIKESELKEAYQTIAEIAGSMDYALMDEILGNLKGYRLRQADRERIRSMEIMLSQLDWDGIINKAGEIQ
ncbi:MAG: response regulator [Lachnospiraceae bacterium]|nr:response regulator [Lachnospiraceae bacterium]